jgi:hypothetical protein
LGQQVPQHDVHNEHENMIVCTYKSNKLFYINCAVAANYPVHLLSI